MALAHRDVGGVLSRHGYTENRKIGEGSFGKALLVQTDDGAKLVCKMVDVSQASRKETDDAVKEGRLLARFRHPYVVRYRDSFIESGWFCILMDYCEGGDLSKQIETAKRRRQPIVEEQILMWITQALLALKYIHDQHVLHRDLKSSNFFLSKSGNLKLGDFGIAKVLASTAACARTQIGTPYYLSPEVCQEKPYTWPSDMWAMGCVLYELCALKVPFDASNISSLVQKICRGPTPTIPGAYSDFLRNLCSEMLSRSASMRPSAESILARQQMQAVVKQMLERAQAAQENRSAPPSGGGAESEAVARVSRIVSKSAVVPEQQPPQAAAYRKGDLVEYHSNTHKDWLPATVLQVDTQARILIDLKPNTWLSREAQAVQVRPKRKSAAEAARPAAAVPTPLRQQHWAGRIGDENASKASREPSPAPGSLGSRLGTPAHDRPSRAASPMLRGAGPQMPAAFGPDRQDRVPGPRVIPPGMPRGPIGHSPISAPRRVFNAAGMAIAGSV
jgi:NIMA (never in mitosis gene a)-related kinase